MNLSDRPLPRRPGRWSLAQAAATAAVVLSALFVAGQGRWSAAIADALSSEGARARPAMYVVFQAADCESRLSFLGVLRRPSLRSRFDVGGVVLGSAAELDASAAALRRAGTDFRLRLGRRADRESAARLGYRETPFLILVDGLGRVRLTAPLPKTAAEHAALTGVLESLAETL